MPFFSEQSDALLLEWLTSVTWYVDKPSENARFYRFAAALMQELGQPDIREVRCVLEEAASAWATGYEERVRETRIDVQCERLQILYDFFNALHPPTATALAPSPVLPPPTADLETRSAPAATTPGRLASTAAQQRTPPATADDACSVPVQAQTSVLTARRSVDDPPTEVPPAPRKRGRRGREVLVEQSVENQDGPSDERWQMFWSEVLRLYDLLVTRQGVTPPALPRHDDTKAVAAEMQRRAHEVLHAEEITGAEKNHLIGTIIDKVTPHRKDDTAVYVDIEWLK